MKLNNQALTFSLYLAHYDQPSSSKSIQYVYTERFREIRDKRNYYNIGSGS